MKKILLIALMLGTTISCTDFEGWNIDEKNPSEVPAAFLFTNAQRAFYRQMVIPSVNSNIFKQMAQHWTTTTYNDETNYDMVQRDIGGNWWFSMYAGVMIDVVEAKKIIAENEPNPGTAANKIAILDLFQSYVWHIVVDTYGNVPYSEALLGNENLIPKYDDDAEIYASVMNTIDQALNTLNETNPSFGGEDLIYGGDVASWRKFGNSLKLKMAVRIADADPTTATAAATAAVDAGVLESNADNAAFPFETSPPNTNPNWEALVQSGRNDYVIANTFADIMNTLSDPRSAVFMDDNVGIPYKGGIYGASNTFSEYTHIGAPWHTPDLEGIILSYDEVNFLMAEAAEKGLIGGGTAAAKMYYEEGIKASMNYWVPEVDDAGIAGYIAQPTVAYNSAEWNKSIGQQKWIALFGRGFEAWSSWRLLDYPEMNIAAVSQESVPRRYIYPNDEPQVNGTNYEAAKTAMGGDLKSNRVFWDINGQGN
ncbi:SusD/RagB family nutrient-binding outer membrane lipoprotein [Lutimonas zeaxanthinifaciens]|uniref:SusD/RagB family nutrient-binding outer membrane lipoprotein n=1 Tax=Lutimonas zeaxanthinifaciens TaxID=3060215 RepID=UPI00265CDDB4|nr:SusD/RagB family nutrient-binding outer membrane lipoprotein [Lutimonas sp. YSD2104]WKK66782.1 SusD/RagB family nutrient-binding outer membrane lipoprotein [Lutimonas sp. YSD2104]